MARLSILLFFVPLISFAFPATDIYIADPPLTIQQKILQELGPDFIQISKCESGMKQYNDDGTVLISRTSDLGLYQINKIHWEEAKKMGIDITTIEGNIAFAKSLKEKNGKDDWYMSRKCWNKLVIK